MDNFVLIKKNPYLCEKITMSKLGYIISDRKISDLRDFVGNVKDISQADLTKPILYIGYKNAKKVKGYKNILEKKIDDKTFWTFKKTESRSDYESDLENFYKYIIINILYNINYYYINIIYIKYNKLKRLYNILFNNTKINYIYISKNMIYFQYENNTYGISLSLLEYCGIKKEKIISRIRMNKNNIIVYDNNEKVHKILKEIGYENKYAVPYLMENID